jgi:hypothetical protein
LDRATLLNAAGYAQSDIKMVTEGEYVKIGLPANAMHVVVENTATTVGKKSQLYLNDHQLLDNYPNPFNAATTIDYLIARPGFVSIDVYNVMGQRVDNLKSANQLPGKYQVRWDIADKPIAGGTYICRLRVGEYEAKKRMLLLK